MIRITRGKIASKKHKKYLKLAKGYVGSNSRLSTLAMEQIIQSGQYAYISRKLQKRTYRRLWIYRINAAARIRGISYSQLMGAFRKLNIFLNRKSLSFLAFNDPIGFTVIEKFVKIK